MTFTPPPGNADDRKAYWIRQTDAAHDFMNQVARQPVQECGEPLQSLPEAVEDAGVEVLFSEKQHCRGLPRIFRLRKSLIPPFIAAAREMNARGWIIKIEDAFRTREMQKNLALADYTFDVILRKVMWELDGRLPSPPLLLKRVTVLVATAPQIGTHMSGSALDISVINRDSRTELSRGAPYLELSELTPMDSPFVSDKARENRRAISDIMRRHGFLPYPYEFWHYSQGDAFGEYIAKSGRTARYGPVDADLETGDLTPIENPHLPLVSLDEIRRAITQAAKRLNAP